MADQSDLQALFPIRDLIVKGEVLKLHPFYFGQIATVARYVKPIVQSLMIGEFLQVIPPEQEGGSFTVKLKDNFISGIFESLESAAEPLMNLVAFAISKDRVWLDTVDPAEGFMLTQQLWEINSDFFVKRVLPLLSRWGLTKSTSTGPTSSPDSSEPVTGAAISTDTP